MPGFVHKGRLLYASPLNHVLRAFNFDSSAFDKETFYVAVFFLPLYIPASHLHLSFGERLRSPKGQVWNLSDPCVREELLACIQGVGLPFLERPRHPCDVAAAIQELGADDDPYRLEAIAYSLAMSDDVSAAQLALERLIKGLDRSTTWQTEMMERATQLAHKLAGNPQEARRQLAEWEQATVKNLGLR
jgi:hypothetical protein